MRIAIAGTGSIGRRHIEQLQGLHPNIDWFFVSWCDSYSEALEAEIFTSLRSALYRTIDALIIATPSSKHADLMVMA